MITNRIRVLVLLFISLVTLQLACTKKSNDVFSIEVFPEIFTNIETGVRIWTSSTYPRGVKVISSTLASAKIEVSDKYNNKIYIIIDKIDNDNIAISTEGIDSYLGTKIYINCTESDDDGIYIPTDSLNAVITRNGNSVKVKAGGGSDKGAVP